MRTVKVGFRRRDKREKAEVYWKKPLVEEILQVAGEPIPSGGADDQLPADVHVRVALIRAGSASSLSSL